MSAPAVTAPDAIRILTELEAAENLAARGWTKITCEPCRGIGHFFEMPPTLLEEERGRTGRICEPCAGYGWLWQPPTGPQDVAPIPRVLR